MLEYEDAEKDMIQINNEQGFRVAKEDFEGKNLKLIIKEVDEKEYEKMLTSRIIREAENDERELNNKNKYLQNDLQ